MNRFQQNQLVRNTILASVGPTHASTIAIVTLAHKACESLHTTFANKSHARIICLQDQLAHITKDYWPDRTFNFSRSVEHNRWWATWCENPCARSLSLKPSGLVKHSWPSEELYEKLLDYEIFLIYEDAKRTTVISAPIAQRNNQDPWRNNINWK